MTGPSTDMTYGGYLHLDQVLDAQHPRTGAHDEMLFIIQHQTSELWMRLVLHEIGAARDMIANGHLQPAFKMLTRVARIFDQLNSAWDVLRTMTPSEYTRFRAELGSSSGFQSHQYRLIEYALGNRNLAMRRIHDHTPEIAEMLSDELTRPSLYQVALRVLETETGSQFEDTAYTLEGPYQAHASVAEAWTVIYRNPDDHWDLYELAEKLVDLEDYFRRWRFNHVTTVERIIGFKKGTGGTAGVPYLRQMLSVELFPELWSLRGGL